MRWYLRLLAPLSALTLPILSTGCGPAPVAAANQSSKETASLDRKAASPLPPISQGRDVSLYESALDADPAVQPAWFASHAMKRSEADLYDHYEKNLRPKLDRARIGKDWESSSAALPAFLEAARILEAMADDVIRADEKFQPIAEKHRKDLARAPPSYRAAAARWREKSAEETNRVIRESYAKFAENAEIFAVVIEERAQAFAKFEAEVALALKFTRKTRDLLREFQVFASLAPSLDTSDLRTQYRDQLRVYVGAFGEFLTLHEEWNTTLRAKPLPTKPTERPTPRPSPQPSPEYTSPQGGSQLVHAKVSRTPNPDTVAQLSAENSGRSIQALLTDLRSEHSALTARVRGYTDATLPTAIRTDLDRYTQRVNYFQSIEHCPVNKNGWAISLSCSADIDAGTYLPIVRGDSLTYVGVVRVGPRLSNNQFALSPVRGDLVKPGDYAIRIPTR
mgnify:CR=1 FL=1